VSDVMLSVILHGSYCYPNLVFRTFVSAYKWLGYSSVLLSLSSVKYSYIADK